MTRPDRARHGWTATPSPGLPGQRTRWWFRLLLRPREPLPPPPRRQSRFVEQGTRPEDELANLHIVARRVEDGFRDLYLTMVSIMQGVALGYLVQQVGADYRSLDAGTIGRAVAILAMIIAIWQEYMIGSTVFAWIPGMLDAITPFVLGAGQGLTIAALRGDLPEFLGFLTCTFVAGLIAEVNYSYRAHTTPTELSSHARKVISVHPRTGPLLALLGVAIGAVLWWLASFHLPEFHDPLVSWLAALPPLIVIISSRPRWSTPMKDVRSRLVVPTTVRISLRIPGPRAQRRRTPGARRLYVRRRGNRRPASGKLTDKDWTS
jgi:hypothetical protein